MALLEEVHLWGPALRVEKPLPFPVFCLCFKLIVEDVSFQLPAAVSDACYHASLPGCLDPRIQINFPL